MMNDSLNLIQDTSIKTSNSFTSHHDYNRTNDSESISILTLPCIHLSYLSCIFHYYYIHWEISLISEFFSYICEIYIHVH